MWREFDYEAERGYLVGVRDAVAGALTATYGPDGQVLSQNMPGGVTLSVGYDAARVPVSRTYRTAGGQTFAASSVVQNSAGQVVSSTSSAAVQAYAYDGLGRLTGAGARAAVIEMSKSATPWPLPTPRRESPLHACPRHWHQHRSSTSSPVRSAHLPARTAR